MSSRVSTDKLRFQPGDSKQFWPSKFRYVALFAICYLLFAIFASSASAATLTRAPTNLGLVGYWSFDEGTTTIAGDSSGNGNTGILTSMAFPPTSTSGWTNQGKAQLEAAPLTG